MKILTKFEANQCLRAALHKNATDDERHFLGYVAGLGAAYEKIEDSEYARASVLCGFKLQVEDSIFERTEK